MSTTGCQCEKYLGLNARAECKPATAEASLLNAHDFPVTTLSTGNATSVQILRIRSARGLIFY
jgi:hypothetical protein